MTRILAIISLLFLFNYSAPLIEQKLDHTDKVQAIDKIQSEVNIPEIMSAIGQIFAQVEQLLKQLNLNLEELPKTPKKEEPIEKIELQTPDKQLFSISNIELGQTKEQIEMNVGAAKRSSLNEYGSDWYAYHNNYHNFFMVMFDENNKASGVYTDQDLISSTNGIKRGSPKDEVHTILGNPLKQIQKGRYVYQFEEDRDYDVYLQDNAYVTIFYDKHEGNTVTAMQMIRKDIEDKKADFYTKASPELKEGFEYQMFDLTNAARVNHQLPVLTWDDHVRETARKHSSDMAVNDYFDHTNLKGQSPFDRMKQDDIIFRLAGENLAYGQFSSIFAHEGLMNSLGHRENILREGYRYLGVGVAFNNESHPYYTENFYAK
ncbi:MULTISPECIES: CAP-associated domain-containing protein [Neobacillus]|uniref:Serine protease n=1 Tax=Neobacillus rhizophilus TaxID=2833579 RepID=A0A942U4N4_9BACI|nr:MULTISPECIES: CAP-associated domain-containing protein [Neobacillus]MBS4210984.1 serine protease [Neobacillus rhizophilus]MBU8917466.1 CAP domain-containing protein [Bacillus sp. FJAT-29953]